MWLEGGSTASVTEPFTDVGSAVASSVLMSSRFAGFNIIASAHGLLLIDKALISSDASVRVFRLALRRSLIPPADSRRAALRKSPLLEPAGGLASVPTGTVAMPVLFNWFDLLERFVVSMYKPVTGLFGEKSACSSTQSAGVGGTGPSEVPSAGACLVGGRGAESTERLEPMSIVPLALCERGAFGGGPGGGPGKGIPGSQLLSLEGDLLPVRLVVGDEQLLEPSAPAEIALRDDGGLTTESCDGTSVICGAGTVISAGTVRIEVGTTGSAACLFGMVIRER
jgi:hypothetical protein